MSYLLLLLSHASVFSSPATTVRTTPVSADKTENYAVEGLEQYDVSRFVADSVSIACYVYIV